MRHDWFRRDTYCQLCGQRDCLGYIAVDFCPIWQAAQARCERGEYLKTTPNRRLGVPLL